MNLNFGFSASFLSLKFFECLLCVPGNSQTKIQKIMWYTTVCMCSCCCTYTGRYWFLVLIHVMDANFQSLHCSHVVKMNGCCTPVFTVAHAVGYQDGSHLHSWHDTVYITVGRNATQSQISDRLDENSFFPNIPSEHVKRDS